MLHSTANKASVQVHIVYITLYVRGFDSVNNAVTRLGDR